jgi:hypothetical protein
MANYPASDREEIGIWDCAASAHEKGRLDDTPWHLAERTGLEPATPGVTGRYSNRLNYRSEQKIE